MLGMFRRSCAVSAQLAMTCRAGSSSSGAMTGSKLVLNARTIHKQLQHHLWTKPCQLSSLPLPRSLAGTRKFSSEAGSLAAATAPLSSDDDDEDAELNGFFELREEILDDYYDRVRELVVAPKPQFHPDTKHLTEIPNRKVSSTDIRSE
jgi:hypothetical protein